MTDGEVPMDTSDPTMMAGVIDATDPPSAMDVDVDGDMKPPAAADTALMLHDDNTNTGTDYNSTTAPNVIPITPQEEEEARLAIDLLRGDDVAGRVEAANKLGAVAAALGVERTRDELLPFLTDGMDDEDEVLAAIASNLRNLIPHVGGPSSATVLLSPLELLLTVEEATVRNEACETAKAIAAALPDESYRTEYADMLSRLSRKEWFTSRMSAANLIAVGYERMGLGAGGSDGDGGSGMADEEAATAAQQCAEHLSNFAALCRDDAPMVRRVASQNLGTVAEAAIKVGGREAVDGTGDESIVVGTLLPLYEELAANTQPDSVRLQITENCVALGRAITTLDNGQVTAGTAILTDRVLPLVVSTIDDRSWRVRWTAASKFADVVGSFSSLPGAMDVLVPAYEKLLQDPEAEVRTAAALNLADVARCDALVKMDEGPSTEGEEDIGAGGADDGARVKVAQRLVKRVTTLTEDDSENVRAALAMVATELAPVLGKEETIAHLVPPVLLLLRDATSEVRLNIISSLSALNEVIGVDLLSQSLLPAIVDLAEDGKWRIRLAIIQHIPLLAEQLGVDFFSDKLASLCVGWLGDDISSIRTAAAVNLKELTALFGAQWANVHLVPSIAEIRQHQSYLRRLTAVQACSMMATAMDPVQARVELLPMMLDMATDIVPNIRFNVAKGLEMMAPVVGQAAVDSQIRPVLAMLMEDPDRDVRYYARKTLEEIDRSTQ